MGMKTLSILSQERIERLVEETGFLLQVSLEHFSTRKDRAFIRRVWLPMAGCTKIRHSRSAVGS